jgi:hypothetical protein
VFLNLFSFFMNDHIHYPLYFLEVVIIVKTIQICLFSLVYYEKIKENLFCNCSLKIWKSIGTPTPKVGAQLGVWGFILSHFLAFLQALAVVASPKLGLREIIWDLELKTKAHDYKLQKFHEEIPIHLKFSYWYKMRLWKRN